MKYLLLVSLFFCLCIRSSAQVDSTKLYSYGVGSGTTLIRANDWERLSPLLSSGLEQYEDVFQLLQSKYKGGAPIGTLGLTMDSVRNDVLLGIYTYLSNMPNGKSGAWSNRIMTALKLPPTSTYVIAQCQAIDAVWLQQQTVDATEGKRRFQRQRN